MTLLNHPDKGKRAQGINNADKYPITITSPVYINDTITDLFDPSAEVFQLRNSTPNNVIGKLEHATNVELERGFKSIYLHNVREYFNSKPQETVVELTCILINVPYKEFIQKIPPEKWGINLAYHLGGEVLCLKRDEQLRTTHQIERMVLAAPIKNLDMTKSEVIVYEKDRSTVYWRVFNSDNHTTILDIGYVEFAISGSESTIIKFQSAHKLYLPNIVLRYTLANTFIHHLKNYKAIAGGNKK